MGNLWWYVLLAAINSLASATWLADHTSIGLVSLMATWTQTLTLAYAVTAQFINLTIPFGVVATVLTLETVRAGIAAYQWIKSQIPMM
jgi:hypothetical protein